MPRRIVSLLSPTLCCFRLASRLLSLLLEEVWRHNRFHSGREVTNFLLLTNPIQLSTVIPQTFVTLDDSLHRYCVLHFPFSEKCSKDDVSVIGCTSVFMLLVVIVLAYVLLFFSFHILGFLACFTSDLTQKQLIRSSI
jgi:hypothetical protein